MKTAIVTGASGNLGQAVINKFLAEGIKVTGTVIHNDPSKVDSSNPDFEAVVADLMDEDKAKEFVDGVILKYKIVDIAVLTVGGFAAGKIAETKTADVMKQYKLNFETAYNVAQPVFTQMMKQGTGRIFLIGSKAGLDARNGKGMVAYGLGKSLIFRLAELMNDEAKGHNVVTSVVVPSTIDTPQNRKAMPDAKFENWVKPEAIADVIYFHCTDQAAAMREPLIKIYGNA
jgi:NAD(P)-dependent dehydrogenase (short-subunit alcohol dehydrogenase family)